jgi:hypothetical protein
MKKDLYYIIGVLVIPSFIVMFYLFTSNNYQISFGIEQDDSISKIKNMASLINASIANSTYSTITNATTPAVATDDKTGSTYVVYFRGENDGANVYIQRTNDSGRTFSEPVRINNIEGSVQLDSQWSPPALGIGPNSELYVVWYNADHSNPDKFPYGQVTLRFAKSTDGGQTFERAINLAPNDPAGEQSYPFIAVSKDNRIFISYLNLDYSQKDNNAGTPTVVRVVSSNDGGKTFGNSFIADKSACQCCATVVAIGPDKEIYTSSRSAFKNVSMTLENYTKTEYQKQQDKDVAVIRDVTVEHSTDGGLGKKFTDPIPVNNDKWFMNGCPDAGPGMDFDSKGKLHIAWFTGSETAPKGQGFYYAHSADKGMTFSEPIPIHLLSQQWIPPTTQYLVTDNHDNSWIVFVNSEGLKKSSTYEEDFSYVGNGTINLAVIDKDGNILRNGALTSGDITKHYPYTSSADNKIVISWIDGDDVKLAFIDTNSKGDLL